jgi:hypothetical protein
MKMHQVSDYCFAVINEKNRVCFSHMPVGPAWGRSETGLEPSAQRFIRNLRPMGAVPIIFGPLSASVLSGIG